MNSSIDNQKRFERQVFAGAAIFVALAALFIVPLLDRVVRDNVSQDLGLWLNEHAELKVATLDAEYTRLEQEARYLVGTPPIQGIVRATETDGFDAEGHSSLDVWEQRLQSIFSAFIASHPSIAQVRYIGVADGGRELVRVERRDGAVVVVPKDELQRKGSREYFVEALKNGPGDVYFSEITLNRERGQVQTPHMPMLRAAIPVYGQQQPFGILIINVAMGDWLQTLAASDGKFQMYLLNQRGDFLAHPDSSKTFGFDLGKPYRWSDQFEVSADQESDNAGHLNTKRYQGPQGTVDVVMKSVAYGPESQGRRMTIAVAAPDSMIESQVATARRIVMGVLIGLTLLGSFLLYLVVLNVRRREEVGVQNARLAAIIDSSNDAIVGKNLDGVVTSWNRAAEKMFGYSAEQAIGQTIESLVVPPERTGEEAEILQRVARGEIVPHFETLRRRADGRLIDVSVTVSPVHSRDGTIIGAAKVARDISEEKATRAKILELNATLEDKVRVRTEELESSLALQRVILDNAGYAIIATRPDSTVTLFNPAAERLLGYTASEVVGKPPPNSLHDPAEIVKRAAELSQELGEQIEPGFEVLIAKARRGLSDEHEWTYIRKDGVRIPVLLKINALVNAKGEVTGFLGIAIDLTEQKKRQQELVRAKADADAANKAKSEFLANMSHEIRTPMNAVLGMLELMQYTELSKRQSDYVEKAESAARGLLGIINDILDFSKIEAGKLVLDPQATELELLLREVTLIVGPSANKKDVELLFDLDPTLPGQVVVDSMRLKQVLINLTGNAVKFTDRGRVTIAVAVVETKGDLLRLEFRVEDTGIGMSPEQQGRVFDAFTQAEAGITRRFGGTGLGLVISQRLVQMMGGHLRLESELNRGSTFFFELDVKRARAEDIPSVQRRPLVELNDLRILVVDDRESTREVITRMARSMGWQADQASSGAQAIQCLQASIDAGCPYQAVFLDWVMPGMDGWQTAEAIHKLPFGERTPALFMMTAHEQEVVEQKMREKGSVVADVLIKPLTASEMMDAVVNALLGSEKQHRPRKSFGTQTLSGMRLLLVEDNATNQIVAQELLSAAGADVEVADNGLVAVDRLRDSRNAFDAVLMDLQMPVMDGFSATRVIRTELGLTKLPIVAMTANAMASDREACLAAGMDEHVGKPFHIEQLVSLLSRVIRGDQGPEASETKAEIAAVDGARDFAIDAALQRMGNNRRLYSEQARVFAEKYVHSLTEVRDLLNAGERGRAVQVLHTLRGVVATLGAMALASQLSGIEQALKDDAEWELVEPMLAAAEYMMKSARSKLLDIADTLQFGETDDTAETNGIVGSVTEITEQLNALKTLLADRNLRALDVFRDVRVELARQDLASTSELDKAMQELDFTRALSVLEGLKTTFETEYE